MRGEGGGRVGNIYIYIYEITFSYNYDYYERIKKTMYLNNKNKIICEIL